MTCVKPKSRSVQRRKLEFWKGAQGNLKKLEERRGGSICTEVFNILTQNVCLQLFAKEQLGEETTTDGIAEKGVVSNG